MKLIFNKINKDIFDALKSGVKKVETRAATVKYKTIQPKEEIMFSCAGESFTKVVSKVRHFDTIESLLVTYKPEDINPKLATKEEIIEMYYSFPGYKEKIEKEGIVAMEFE